MNEIKRDREELISIVVPTFNGASYLNRCVLSLLEQTYKKTEIILVDDGSTDDTSLICEQFAERDSRVVVIHQKNAGVSAARNTGISNAKGDYVALVDGDDYISPQMIEKLYKRMVKDQADVAICGYKKVNEKGYKLGEVTIPDAVVSGIQAIQMHYQSTTGIMPVPWNKLYCKKLFSHVRFPEGKRCEDEATFYLLLNMCDKVSILSEPCYYYVQHEDSFMGGKYKVARLDGVEASYDRYLFYREHSDRYQELLQPEGRAFLWLFYDAVRHFHPSTNEERVRFREIYRMARIMSSQSEANWSLRELMKLRFPELYVSVRNIKDTFCYTAYKQ